MNVFKVGLAVVIVVLCTAFIIVSKRKKPIPLQDRLNNKLKIINKETGKKRDSSLVSLWGTLKSIENSKVVPVLSQIKLASLMAQVIREHNDWSQTTPAWVNSIVFLHYSLPKVALPSSQDTISLVEAILGQLNRSKKLNNVWFGCLEVIFQTANKGDFLNNAVLYDTMKKLLTNDQKNIVEATLRLLCILTNGDDKWQSKVIRDKQFVHFLLSLYPKFANDQYWGIWLNLSQHEDARTLLPVDVVNVVQRGEHKYCMDIFANLCTQNTAVGIKITDDYIGNKVKEIKDLLAVANNVEAKNADSPSHNLSDLLLPLANLSIGDGNKDPLAKAGVVELLFQVIQINEKNPLIPQVGGQLPKAKRIASEALWNLAFHKDICETITNTGGLQIIQQYTSALEPGNSNSETRVLKKNLEGIYFMCTDHPDPTSEPGKAKHIMISYNRGVQELVKRLVIEMKRQGYRIICLDFEKVQGSMIDATVAAIEESELVIMCMSQKYKDSANGRFEGEYSMQRNVDVIPLLVQADYKPDGWLELIVEQKQYYNFADESKEGPELANLVAALGDRCRDIPEIRPLQQQNIPPPLSSLPPHMIPLPPSPLPSPRSPRIADQPLIDPLPPSLPLSQQRRVPVYVNFESVVPVVQEKVTELEAKLRDATDAEEIRQISKALNECIRMAIKINAYELNKLA